MKETFRTRNRLVARVLLACCVLSVVPVLPFVVNDFLDHRTCVAATHTIRSGATVRSTDLEQLPGIQNRHLPDDSVRKAGEIVGREATKELKKGECISFASVDAARVRVVMPAVDVVVSGDVDVGSRIDLVVSPAGGEIASDGLVIEGAILLSADNGFVTVAVTDDERTELAALIGRSRVLMSLAGEVAAP